MHEKFEELAATASIGQAGPQGLALFEQHLMKCDLCRRSYSEFTNIASQEYARTFDEGRIASYELGQFTDADLLRQRFLQRAAEKGVSATHRDTPRDTSRGPSIDTPNLLAGSQIPPETGLVTRWKQPLRAIAAVFLISLSVLWAYKLRRYEGGADRTSMPLASRDASRSAAAVPISQLADPNAALEQEVAWLVRELERARAKLRDTQGLLSTVSGEKKVLANRQAEEDEVIQQLQGRLEEAEALLTTSKQETARLRTAVADAQASYVANQIRIRELTGQLSEKTADLSREQQLLQRDRDVRELMVARDLHMYDVFDTDPRGKTRPAFGRIFYTGGKSLIFYAYDLNNINSRNAEYHYRVWGGKEGQDDRATSLGIFYSDDKAERRWVFRCDDPKILSQIDSVFVTLERSGIKISHPRGQKLLDAYLRGLPNHP